MNNSIIKNQRIFNSLSEFFYSKYYPVYLALFTVFFYTAKIPMAGLVFYALLSAITLISFRDLTPFMPLPMMIMMSFSDIEFLSSPISLILLGLIATCMISHFFIYPIKKFIFGKLFVPICIVSVALLCGGLFSPYINEYSRGISSALSVGPGVLFVYVYFSNYSCPPKNINPKERILYLLCAIGLMLSLEMIVHELYTHMGILEKYNMGYGNINIFAVALLMTIPPCWYFICKKKTFIPYAILLVLIYLGIFLSHSDGVLAISVCFIPVLAILGYQRTDDYHRKIFIRLALIICFAVIAVVFVYSLNHDIVALIIKIFNKVKTDNMRTALYMRALNLFSKNPVFGVSLGYFDGSLINPAEGETYIVYLMSFHSTFFHLLATTGIVGLLSYVIYYIARYKIILNNNSTFNLTVFLSFTLYQIYGMISHEEFQMLPILLYATLLLLTTEKHNKEKDNDLPLPLTNKILNYKTFN